MQETRHPLYVFTSYKLRKECRIFVQNYVSDFSLLLSVQTDAGTRPDSYTMSTVDSFPGGKATGA
jgi:hypothetical protein